MRVLVWFGCVWFGLAASVSGQAISFGEDGCEADQVSFELVTGTFDQNPENQLIMGQTLHINGHNI